MARDGELQRRLPCHSVPARQIDGVGRILKKNGLGGSISHPVLDVMRRRPLRDNRQIGSDLGMGESSMSLRKLSIDHGDRP
jgi:hypothetical protein